MKLNFSNIVPNISMTLPEKHFKETKRIIKKVGSTKTAKWLLEEGYFPEQYVLPPPFKVNKFDLNKDPFYKVKKKGTKNEFKPDQFALIELSYPKTQLTERSFGIINPKIYHDLIWYLHKDWDLIINHLFHKDIKIYSYSFPIPISKKSKDLSSLRVGRMIYEFIEMAENDLVAESHEYQYILKCDIKNFYPTIYTHSIAWALHGKVEARKDKFLFLKLGTLLDKLLQNANDGCTNGLPIGPAISDLIAEILLASIDKDCSKDLMNHRLDFLGVRYKDDYRFLCHSKEDAQQIIKILQDKMKYYNLTLNENKCDIQELPQGLYRNWAIEYQKYSLRYKKAISFKKFENSLLEILKIDAENKDTGIIDRFLSDLSTKDYNLKLSVTNKKALKTYSLLMSLKKRRAKSFPHILAILEKIIIDNRSNTELIERISLSLENLLDNSFRDQKGSHYTLLWLSYFVKANGLFKIKWPVSLDSVLLMSIKSNRQKYFTIYTNDFFTPLTKPGKNHPLLNHLAVFSK